ncbi:MAG TPA: hypothetical protein H9914_12200 [Candidatus Blautia avicola]|uniref:Uroporphyrinogen decarboxylase (URO-D) domain-containing protein n=1 Tax=Candidatus Blautia avicola TaxID=2838483 RepID=A0A9D2QUB6_9FIRM|nr:hypothetical protein [Candidatus Blautia avicola]
MAVIEGWERQRLRELAKKQLDYAEDPVNKKRIQEWYDHNDLKGQRPMIQLEIWGFEQEIIEPRLKCQSPEARELEWQLYQNFLNRELFDDDKVVPDYFPMNYDTWFKLFDIDVQVADPENTNRGLGHKFIPVLGDLEEDYENGKIKASTYGVNLENTQKKAEFVQEIIGDILPVKIKMDCLYSVPTQMLVHIMGMEQMMMNMYDYPELFQRLMEQIEEDTLSYYKMLEDKRLILPTTGFETVGQGTMAFTRELPGEDTLKERPLTPGDVWGFMDSQETLGISPDMYEELVFPCYEKIGKQFGLLSYGCCEPVNPIWDRCLTKFKNLRKVSISPWCDEEFMGERLRDSKVIYQRKPSPNYLGVSPVLDEEALRAHFRKTLEAAKGCKLEFTQRDVYTLHGNENKGRRYIEILREEIEDKWQM